jgi:Ca2+/H+ antiporter
MAVAAGAAMCRYLLYLFFELHTHNFLFTSSSDEGNVSAPRLSSGGAVLLLALITAGVAVASECVAHLLHPIDLLLCRS